MYNLKFCLALFLSFCCWNVVSSQQTVGLFLDSEEASDAYTLFGNNKKTYLIDPCGYTVKVWESDFDPGLSMYLLENGDLLRTGRIDGFFGDSEISGQFELFNWEGDLIWNYEYRNEHIRAHHDIEPLPNGNFLFIAWERISEEEAKLNGRKFDGDVWSEKIIELEMIGSQEANIVWEWRLWDHLVQDFDSTKMNYGSISENPDRVDLNFIGAGENTNGDWTHFNAIAYHPELDQIAISARHISEIWIIDHSTTTAEAKTNAGGNSNRGGRLLYRFGNPQTYQRGTAEDQLFFKQHDVRWVPKGHPLENHLMVFNNLKTDTSSSIEVWKPPLEQDGTYTISDHTAFGPNEISWEYNAPGFFSRILSGAHFLPNDNLFITSGINGRLFEVAPDKSIVWEYINPSSRTGMRTVQGEVPFRNDVFRATKYPFDYPAFRGEALESGAPIERNPWEIICDTTKVDFNIDDDFKVQISKNPVSDFLHFEARFPDDLKIMVRLFDTSGKTIFSETLKFGTNEFSVSNLPSGLYILHFSDQQKSYQVQKILKL